MGAPLNLIGQAFGRFTVVKRTHARGENARLWECVCTCGNVRRISTGNLRSGNSKSCGCLNLELIAERGRTINRKHGHRGSGNAGRSKVYAVWTSMLQRCLNPSAQAWHNYGGRGITVCQRWRKFEHFMSDMGEPNGLDLDRINNERGYSPNNCRWTTRSENIKNTRLRKRNVSGRFE